MADGSVPLPLRAAAGNGLAVLGDPRFDAGACYLPADPHFGFIEIPAGPFTMGSDKSNDSDAHDNEQPRHVVTLPTYYIGKYPVTVAQFCAFVEATEFQVVDTDCLRGAANHPVVLVNWHEAMAYCAWLTGVLRQRESEQGTPLFPALGAEWLVTLSSEAEWEKAARGSADARRYPWGDEWDARLANGRDSGIYSTSAVGCFPAGASPYGVQEMSGNVWEWTRSAYMKYPYDGSDGREAPATERTRVMRGGGWDYNPRYLRVACRNYCSPMNRYNFIGFRCVLRLPGR